MVKKVINEVFGIIQDLGIIVFIVLSCILLIKAIIIFNKIEVINIDNEPVEVESEVIEVDELINEAPIEVVLPPTREDYMRQDYDALSAIEDEKEWYLCYLGFIEDYPEYERGSTLYDRYNEDEIYIMQRVIETEVYGCDFEAKTHVASVILNRIEGDNNFSNDATTVCTSPGQFVYSRKTISEDTKLALEYVAEFGDTTEGALYFNSMAPMDSWCGRKRIFTDHVGHSFY